MMIAVIVVILLAYLAVVVLGIRRNFFDEARFFLVSVIPLALVILLMTSVHAAGDGGTHFWTTYYWSNEVLGVPDEQLWQARAEDVEFYDKLPGDFGIVIAEDTWEDVHLFVRDDTPVKMSTRPTHMTFYSVLSYLPQVLGLSLGRMLGLSSLFTVLLARLFILAVYASACYFAIRRTPIGKGIFMALALMPYTLTIASSFTYDVMVFIVTISFVSFVFSLMEKCKASGVVGLIVCAFLLGAIKGGGFLLLLPLAGMLLFKNAGGIVVKKRVILVVSAVVVAAASVILFDLVIPAGQRLFQFGEEYASTTLGATYAFTNPFSYTWLVIKTYAVNIFESIITFGKTSTGFLNLLMIILFTLYASQECMRVRFCRAQKIIGWVVVFLVFFYTPVMLLGFTTADETVIGGLRARYYLPVMPVLMALVSQWKIWSRLETGGDGQKGSNRLHLSLSQAGMFLCAGINVIGVLRMM